jgi:hypothetical protein
VRRAYLIDALEPADMTKAADVVVQLIDVLNQPAPHPEGLVSRLSEVGESPVGARSMTGRWSAGSQLRRSGGIEHLNC